MTRLVTSGRSQVLVGLLVLLGCCGATCESMIPQPQFLLMEPIELQQSGFCEDWGPGEAFHQGETCMRQENCLFNCPQICQDPAGDRIDSRDTVSPVIGTAPNGRCLYDMPWDPVSGVTGHPILWAHAITDIIGPALAPSVFGEW